MIEPQKRDLRQFMDSLRRQADLDHISTMFEALLQWAIRDAELAFDAGMDDNAEATLESVAEYIADGHQILKNARDNPVEARRPDIDENPYITALNQGLAEHAVPPPDYEKSEDGYGQIDDAWQFRTLGDNCCVMAWGLTDPRSAWHGNPKLVKNLLATMQAVLQYHKDGDYNPGRTARFGADPNIPRFAIGPTIDAYYRLDQNLSWLLLAAKRSEWLQQLRVCVEHQYQHYGLQRFEDGDGPAGRYPNQDVYYLLICEIAHRLFGDDKFSDHVDWILECLADAVYPMGAMTYIRTQNECFTYHNLNITFLARYLELTGDERARDIIESTVEFYPLMVEPSGLVENYTDSSWKHYLHKAAPHGPDIVAAITGDRQNKRCAQIALQQSQPADGVNTVFTAPWWKDMNGEALPDDYIVFDENVKAPRGRFGAFSIAANGRDYGDGYIGKDTFIGCLYSPPHGADGESGSLMVATSEFRLQPTGRHWQNARFVSGDEQFSHIIGDEFFSIAVRYRLTMPRHGCDSELLPWQGTQQWFAGRNRLIGLLHIAPLEDHEAAGVWGRLRFGRDGEITQQQEALYRYGPLLARIHDHNYAEIVTQPSEIFYLDEPEEFDGSEIILKDAADATEADDPKKIYPAGTDHWFLCEVFSYLSNPADTVSRIDSAPIRGFQFREQDTRWIVLHNVSTTSSTWSRPLPGDGECIIHTPNAAHDGISYHIDNNSFDLTLGPHAHAVAQIVIR